MQLHEYILVFVRLYVNCRSSHSAPISGRTVLEQSRIAFNGVAKSGGRKTQRKRLYTAPPHSFLRLGLVTLSTRMKHTERSKAETSCLINVTGRRRVLGLRCHHTIILIVAVQRSGGGCLDSRKRYDQSREGNQELDAQAGLTVAYRCIHQYANDGCPVPF
jgi:hypothetical protein